MSLVRGLSEEDVRFRLSMGYTEPQAERRPGWWPAKMIHGPGEWSDCMELRDSEGQLIERMTIEDYRETSAHDLLVREGMANGRSRLLVREERETGRDR